VLRAVYRGDRKVVYDAEGDARTYRLDGDRPCWQAPVDEPADVDGLDALFDGPIAAFAERVRGDGTGADPEMDRATRDRLEKLGYI
jgi:hypothetical protein